MAERTGIAVEELSALSYVAKRSGIDVEALEMGIRKMQKTLFEGDEGSAKARRTLRELGIDFRDLQKLTPDQQLEKLADAMKAVDDPTRRTGLAMAIFGKQGTALIPFLEKGSEGIDKLKAKAKEMGIVLGQSDVASAKEFRGAMADLKASAMAVTIAIGQAVVPAMSRMRERIMPIVTTIVAWIRQNKGLFDVLLDVGTGITVAGGALIVIGQTVKLLGPAMLGMWKAGGLLISGFTVSLKLVAAGFTFLFTPMGAILGLLAALTMAWVLFTNSGKNTVKALAGVWEGFGAIFTQTWQGIVNALKSGDLAAAGKIAFAGLKLAWLSLMDLFSRGWTDLLGKIKIRALEAFADLLTASVRMRVALGIDSEAKALEEVKGIWKGMDEARKRVAAQVAAENSKDNKALAEARAELNQLTTGARFKAGKQLEVVMSSEKKAATAVEMGGTGAGTFSAVGAGRMGAGIGWQRLVDTTKDNGKTLAEIRDAIRMGGLRFT